MTRRLLLPALMLCVAAPVHAQDASTRLAELITSSSSSSDPVMTFVTGVQSLPNMEMSQDDIRRALAQANVPVSGGPLGELLGGTTKLKKSGNQLEMRRSRTFQQELPGGSGIKFGKKVTFKLSSGFVGALGQDDAERLRNADGSYVHLDDVDGIEVKKAGGSFYNLYELFFVAEGQKPVVHLKAGVWFHKEWHRIELPSPEAEEAPAPEDLASREPTPTRQPEVPAEEEAGLPAETPLVRDLDSDRVAMNIAPTPIVDAPAETTAIIDAPAETTAVVDEPTDQAEPRDEQGMLRVLDQVSAPSQQQVAAVASDEADPLASEEPVEAIASSDAPRTQSNQTPADAPVVDRPLEELIKEPEEAMLAEAGDAAETSPAADSRRQTSAPAQAEASRLPLDTPQLPEDAVIEAKDSPEVAAIPLPTPEEKERIDAAAEETKAELDAEGDKLDELIALIKKDRAAAEERLEARLKAIEEQNRRMEERLARLEQALLDDQRRSLPGDDYTRRPSDRYDRRPVDDRRPYDRYDRVDDRRPYDRYDRRPVDDRYDRRDRSSMDDRYRAPITGAAAQPEKKSALERILAKVLEGIKKGLQQRYAREQAKNLQNRGALLANGNPANVPYADYRMRTAIANSNMGNTLGYTNPATVPGVITIPYTSTTANPMNRVPANAAYSTGYTPGAPTTYAPAPVFNPAPISGPVNNNPGAYVVPIR